MESDIGDSLNLFLILFLVVLNGFFVASEFAIVKVRYTRIQELIEQGVSQAQTAQKVISQMDAYLSATQLGITLASLGLGWIGEPTISAFLRYFFQHLGVPDWLIQTLSLLIAFCLITFLHIVIGEMAPKTLAIRKAETMTLWTAAPLHWFYKLFKPCIILLNGTANLILKLFKVEATDTANVYTEEEIRMLIAQSHQSGVIGFQEKKLMDNLFDFNERIVREVMVPRVNMICLYQGHSFAENFDIMRRTSHTRFPLCGKDKDDVIGMIHVRDVYECFSADTPPSLTLLARQAIAVPETMEIKEVLRRLQKKRVGMAIVIDEFGGTSGLVTTEDIIEEIFGDIQDEFDDEPPPIVVKGNQTFINSHLLIDEVNRLFQIEIQDEDNDTIGGWIFSQLGKLPKQGDTIPFAHLDFQVAKVVERRVTQIVVKQRSSIINETMVESKVVVNKAISS
ncbi:CBS domain containing-hemolysin-like protein [Hazenella coriacea]|uniref:CBS domain containing-hemolysin-like protein n=1 Tax=Hazenella coriacea TaxID=1179467 RepID=A0A4V2UV00_9BACL|nr:CBS domain containing-hemolysin-like protein [Hazenella coriacea]